MRQRVGDGGVFALDERMVKHAAAGERARAEREGGHHGDVSRVVAALLDARVETRADEVARALEMLGWASREEPAGESEPAPTDAPANEPESELAEAPAPARPSDGKEAPAPAHEGENAYEDDDAYEEDDDEYEDCEKDEAT